MHSIMFDSISLRGWMVQHEIRLLGWRLQITTYQRKTFFRMPQCPNMHNRFSIQFSVWSPEVYMVRIGQLEVHPLGCEFQFTACPRKIFFRISQCPYTCNMYSTQFSGWSPCGRNRTAWSPFARMKITDYSLSEENFVFGYHSVLIHVICTQWILYTKYFILYIIWCLFYTEYNITYITNYILYIVMVDYRFVLYQNLSVDRFRLHSDKGCLNWMGLHVSSWPETLAH